MAKVALKAGQSRSRPSRRRGSHTTAQLQTCTISGPGASKHQQNSTRRHPEQKKMGSGEGKKSAKFRAPNPFGAPRFEAPPFTAPPFEAPPLLSLTFRRSFTPFFFKKKKRHTEWKQGSVTSLRQAVPNLRKTRLSRRTSCTAGPLVTRDVLLSRRDVASALAAVQLSRLRPAHFVPGCSLAQDSALAFDSAARNSAVSPHHLPPTSSTQHEEACASSLPHQLVPGPSLPPPSVIQCCAILPAALLRAVPSCCKGDTMVVSMANGAAVEDCQTIDNDFQSLGPGLPPSANPLAPRTPASAHARLMVAHGSPRETATSAGAERLRVDSSRPRHGECHQDVAGERTPL